ncbi:nuclear transport factor 2 family protein [Streptomyces sp. NPDC058572]|uniref:nuclear transport factor 2 family protein n=1 Tax=Streptomyces sp. NPDC058572 TaxID=3346546 RepID=UPI00365094C8
MPKALSAHRLTEEAVRSLAERWYAALDRHDGLEEVKKFVVDDGLEMRFPEGTFRGHSGIAQWYKAVSHRFFDEEHTVTGVRADIDGAEARVHISVNWQARVWNPPAARSEWLGFDADQTWVVVAGAGGTDPLIKTYICNALEPMPGSAPL